MEQHPHPPVRVQAVFHVSSEEQAQAVAAKMVDRAHEIANLPECECDVDVSIERTERKGRACSIQALHRLQSIPPSSNRAEAPPSHRPSGGTR